MFLEIMEGKWPLKSWKKGVMVLEILGKKLMALKIMVICLWSRKSWKTFGIFDILS